MEIELAPADSAEIRHPTCEEYMRQADAILEDAKMTLCGDRQMYEEGRLRLAKRLSEVYFEGCHAVFGAMAPQMAALKKVIDEMPKEAKA